MIKASLRRYYRPLAYGFIAAVAGAIVSFLIKAQYTVRGELSVNTPNDVNVGSSLLGLAQRFGLGTNSGAGSPDFVVALFESEGTLEIVVSDTYPRSTYEDLDTSCDRRASSCRLLDIWKIDGRNHRDTLERAAKKLTRVMNAAVEPRTGLIEVQLKAPSPELAVAIGNRLIGVVDSTNSELQARQADQQAQFMRAQVVTARTALRVAEDSLAVFDLSNRTVATPGLLKERTRLQRNVTLAETFYLQLSANLQQLYMASANNTSTLSIVQAPQLPGRRSWPKRSIITLTAFLLGLIVWAVQNHGSALIAQTRSLLR